MNFGIATQHNLANLTFNDGMCVDLNETLTNNMWKTPKNYCLPQSNYKFDPWFEILHDIIFHLALGIFEIASLNLRYIKINQKLVRNLGMIQVFWIVRLLIQFEKLLQQANQHMKIITLSIQTNQIIWFICFIWISMAHKLDRQPKKINTISIVVGQVVIQVTRFS